MRRGACHQWVQRHADCLKHCWGQVLEVKGTSQTLEQSLPTSYCVHSVILQPPMTTAFPSSVATHHPHPIWVGGYGYCRAAAKEELWENKRLLSLTRDSSGGEELYPVMFTMSAHSPWWPPHAPLVLLPLHSPRITPSINGVHPIQTVVGHWLRSLRDMPRCLGGTAISLQVGNWICPGYASKNHRQNKK